MYLPHSFGTEYIPDRLFLSLWTFKSSLQPAPTSFLAETSLWPNMLLTSPAALMLNELHMTLFTHIFLLHLNLKFNFHFHHI